jgi:hypothetical protein
MAGENPFLTDFAWRVVAGGHRWIRAKPFGARDKPDSTYLVDGAAPGVPYKYERYLPLKEETGLFKIFAEAEPTEESISEFADRFGMLRGDDREKIVPKVPIGNPHQNIVGGETFNEWAGEIFAMRQAVYLWDLVRNADLATLGQLFTLREDDIIFDSTPEGVDLKTKPPKPLSTHIRSFSRDRGGPGGEQRFEKGDLIQPALYHLQGIVNDRLKAETASRLLWDADSRDLVLRMVPKNLLGAIWFQFAEMVSKKQGLKQCEQCGKWFRVAAGIGRTDKKYCSQRCRTQWYRHRTAQAARLYTRGKAPAEIAKQFETDVRTVEVWIASGRTPLKRRGSRK